MTHFLPPSSPSSSGTHTHTASYKQQERNQQARKQVATFTEWLPACLPPSDARIWGKSMWELDSLPHTFHKYEYMILWLSRNSYYYSCSYYYHYLYVIDRYTISLQCSLPVSESMQFQDWSQKTKSCLNIWFWGIFTQEFRDFWLV